MDRWPYTVDNGISPDDAQTYCVNDANWQKVRLSMKGKPTHEKLIILHDWYENGLPSSVTRNTKLNPKGYSCNAIVRLQITNYLGALRRGGQLDENNKIRKYI